MDRQEFIATVSDKMKLVRIEADYTQGHMAEILGISKKTLVQIEKGRSRASWTVAVAFCTLFRDSELLQGPFGDDLLEIISIVAFKNYKGAKEKTMGGKFWWREVAHQDGFRLQQNLISQHFRILDQDNRRWCSSFDEGYLRKLLATLGN